MDYLPKLLVIEGGEGSGKSTLIAQLKAEYNFTFTREPGGTVFAEAVRAVALRSESKTVPDLALMLSFFGMRVDHINQTINPSLEKQVPVVCDRFDASTFAYQAENYESLFWTLRNLIVAPLHPVYIYLEIDPRIGLERKHVQQELNVFEEKDSSFHRKVFARYARFFDALPSDQIYRIDASQHKKDVLDQVRQTIGTILSKNINLDEKSENHSPHKY